MKWSVLHYTFLNSTNKPCFFHITYSLTYMTYRNWCFELVSVASWLSSSPVSTWLQLTDLETSIEWNPNSGIWIQKEVYDTSSLAKKSTIPVLLQRKDWSHVARGPKIRQTRVFSSPIVIAEQGEIPDIFSLAYSEFLGWLTESKWLFWDKRTSAPRFPRCSSAIQTCQESRVDADYVQRATCSFWNTWKNATAFGLSQDQPCSLLQQEQKKGWKTRERSKIRKAGPGILEYKATSVCGFHQYYEA